MLLDFYSMISSDTLTMGVCLRYGMSGSVVSLSMTVICHNVALLFSLYTGFLRSYPIRPLWHSVCHIDEPLDHAG